MSRRASGTVNSGDIATTAEIARSAVEKYRLEGNAAYAKAKYKDAISAYGQAIQAYWQLARGDEVEARKDRERMVEVLGAGTPSVSALVESSSSFLSSAFASAVSSLTGAPAPPADASSIASSSQQLSSTVEVADLRPAVLYSNRSAALVHLRRYKLAQEDASFAMRLEPDWPKGYFRTAEALIGERRYDEALAYLHRSLERHGDEEVQAKIVLQRRIQHTASLLHDKNSGLRIMQLLAGRDFATSSWSRRSCLRGRERCHYNSDSSFPTTSISHSPHSQPSISSFSNLQHRCKTMFIVLHASEHASAFWSMPVGTWTGSSRSFKKRVYK